MIFSSLHRQGHWVFYFLLDRLHSLATGTGQLLSLFFSSRSSRAWSAETLVRCSQAAVRKHARAPFLAIVETTLVGLAEPAAKDGVYDNRELLLALTHVARLSFVLLLAKISLVESRVTPFLPRLRQCRLPQVPQGAWTLCVRGGTAMAYRTSRLLGQWLGLFPLFQGSTVFWCVAFSREYLMFQRHVRAAGRCWRRGHNVVLVCRHVIRRQRGGGYARGL